eukprot:12074378-Alexandrium_andersonii.AAC.1
MPKVLKNRFADKLKSEDKEEDVDRPESQEDGGDGQAETQGKSDAKLKEMVATRDALIGMGKIEMADELTKDIDASQ